MSTIIDPSGRRVELLEGTPYTTVAMPLDYMPSRNFVPRWGNIEPRIPMLDDWFRRNTAQYRDFLAAMRQQVQNLAAVPLVFTEEALPSPAWGGVPYCSFDALALYTMVRRHRPRLYIEIGSGITTCFTFKAIRDGNLSTRIVSIDPSPRTQIDNICSQVIRDGLETCDLSIFDSLEAGDILFLDGSHRTFMNSDVTVFFIDVLPRLKPGVIVHVHDIMLPWDYPESFRSWYWNEQYMLAVYMMGNRHRIDPILPNAFVCRDEAFEDEFRVPMLDLGHLNDGWRGGGAMWFTHTS